mgnify:CR=1 FL=1
MIGTILSGIMQAGGAVYGAAKSAKLNNKARQLLDESQARTKEWYEARLDDDYMSRTDVQAALTSQKKLLDEKYKQARATNVVAGGTDESLALQQRAANESVEDAARSIASQAASYKERVGESMMANDRAYAEAQAQDYRNQADRVAQAAAQLGKASGGLIDDISAKKVKA